MVKALIHRDTVTTPIPVSDPIGQLPPGDGTVTANGYAGIGAVDDTTNVPARSEGR